MLLLSSDGYYYYLSQCIFTKKPLLTMDHGFENTMVIITHKFLYYFDSLTICVFIADIVVVGAMINNTVMKC